MRTFLKLDAKKIKSDLKGAKTKYIVVKMIEGSYQRIIVVTFFMLDHISEVLKFFLTHKTCPSLFLTFSAVPVLMLQEAVSSTEASDTLVTLKF